MLVSGAAHTRVAVADGGASSTNGRGAPFVRGDAFQIRIGMIT
jgi:hypothetical protein